MILFGGSNVRRCTCVGLSCEKFCVTQPDPKEKLLRAPGDHEVLMPQPSHPPLVSFIFRLLQTSYRGAT